MTINLQKPLLLFLFFTLLRAFEEQEEFTEELLLKPLPDHKVLAHFHFESKSPPSLSNGRHHHIFPKAISQLVHKFRIKEMELSFTQGRWNYEKWGGYDPISSSNAKPPGVELWAVFAVPQNEVDFMWKNLTHALSGLFCASINFLESSTSYSSPKWSLRSASGNLRYGSLPREAVCTENLTPWLKLLPCRDKAGLSMLMDRPSIYSGFYHSQRLHVTAAGFNLKGVDAGLFLEQTLTVVLQPNLNKNSMDHLGSKNLQPSWSLSSIFGRKVNGQCVVAKSSNVYLLLEKGLVMELKNLQEKHGNDGADNIALENIWSNPGFELSSTPNKVFKEVGDSQVKVPSILYMFPMDNYSSSKQFDLGLRWKFPMKWSAPLAPLHATRFLMGSGNERGAIAISLLSTKSDEERWRTDGSHESCKIRVDVFQVVPWYVKVYYHTLQIFVDGQPQEVGFVVEDMYVSPSKDKLSPGVMEMILKLPCHIKRAVLTLEFDKGFLHIDEYPPDANQGFDIPSAIISFPDFKTSFQFLEEDSLNISPMFIKLQENNTVQSYTEVLLVPLTTPDFSMPYNVITITCTVFALYFGSLLNVLRRRVGEEERLLKDRAASTSRPHLLISKLYAKLRRKPLDPSPSTLPSTSSSSGSFKMIFKIIIVAGVAIVWQYYLK